MAGYHALKEKENGDEAVDMGSSSDENINKTAKQKAAEAKRHSELREKHLEKAKSVHNPKKHGEWNETIPGAKEAMKYGTKHASTIEGKHKDMGAVGEDEVKKAFEVLGLDIIKGGEGSKGGKVIGHTKSGKPIYAHPAAKGSGHFGASSKEEKSRLKYLGTRGKGMNSESFFHDTETGIYHRDPFGDGDEPGGSTHKTHEDFVPPKFRVKK